MKKVFGFLVIFFLFLGGTAAAVFLSLLSYALKFRDTLADTMYKIGFTDHIFHTGATELHYVEGPDNGPPLLLIHGQTLTWQSYGEVLRDLAREYHVFALDCHGHGGSSQNPERYDIESMGQDFTLFIKQIIGRPAIVTGYSYGGLLAAWLGAHAADLVKGVVLEDPPFFTSEYPRITQTYSYKLFEDCRQYVHSGARDILHFMITHSTLFALPRFIQNLLLNFIKHYRIYNPEGPVEIVFVPPVLRHTIKGLQSYDPRFGLRFIDGSWFADWDHTTLLKKISCPAILIHAHYEYDTQGLLIGAMDEDDAKKAASLIKNCRLVTLDTEHIPHLDKPGEFIGIVKSLM